MKMGHRAETKCLKCGETFSRSHGGGFFFHLLHCELCDDAKSIDFEALGELHTRYVKGLPGPYCSASYEGDLYIQQHVDVEPISRADYLRGVEEFAGSCTCGGQYRFDATPRCPSCKSTEVEKAEVTVWYD